MFRKSVSYNPIQTLKLPKNSVFNLFMDAKHAWIDNFFQGDGKKEVQVIFIWKMHVN